MTKYTTVLGSLLRYLSRSEFESAISGYKADRRVRKFSTWDLFKSMVYGQLAGCWSVREIIHFMKANVSRLYHAGLKLIKRSTFCDAMERRRHEIFQSVFHSVSCKAQRIAGSMKKKFKDPLRIIDASIISFCLSRFKWAEYRKAKGAIKLHMNLDGDNLIPFEAYLTNGKTADVKGLGRICGESGVIYALDRGYVDFKSLYSIELGGSIFVTRYKSGIKYRKIKSNKTVGDGPVISDVLIELTGIWVHEYYPKALRKIKYCDVEHNKIYEFLTNDLERDAEEIAAIYKERWQVELFFKHIKQHLRIKTFWGTSENAVYSQVWVALIISILLWIQKTLEGITAGMHEILVMIKSTLLTKNNMYGLTLSPPPTAPPGSSQLLLEGLLC